MHYVPGSFLKIYCIKGQRISSVLLYNRMSYRAGLQAEKDVIIGYNSYKDRSFSVKYMAYIMERRKAMISFMLCLLILTVLFGIAYKITGAILKACVWLLILLPIGLILTGVGVILCCTIILIPVGIGMIKTGFRVILPG